MRSFSRKSVYECVRDPDLIRDDTSNKMKFVTSFCNEMGPSFGNKNTIARICNLVTHEMHAFTLKNDKPIRIVYIALIVINGYVIDFSSVIYYMCNDCVAE